MIFTAEKKAELLAFIETLEPSVDTAPLLARIAELEAQVADLQGKIAAAKAALE
jgi:BMFP domain-containing protein YqiC